LRLLVDTTYLLPLIGVKIREIPRDFLTYLMDAGHEVVVSEISLFELSAKGAKYVAQGDISSHRVLDGIRTLLYSGEIEVINVYDSTILDVALKIRSLLSDFIDCLIVSSAMNCCDILVTEDTDIHQLMEKGEYKRVQEDLNSDFMIVNRSYFTSSRA